MTDPAAALVRDDRGRRRCWWGASTPDYAAYHDEEWGRPVTDDRGIYERMVLEGFQSGLSWLTILRKRDGFAGAFEGWDVERIAAFGPGDVERLLADASIVRNRAKIEATIANARAVRLLSEDDTTLDRLLWSFAPEPPPAPPEAAGDLAPATAESKAMARELKRRGFAFVGPTTAYSFMQAAGLVNDHLAGCAFR
jgi:DNA-3-methyladenine glycosylase I